MNFEGWQLITIGDFVSFQRGHDLTESQREPGNVPVMGSAGISGFHSVAKAKGPGVTIGRSGVGSFGVVNYSPVDYWPHNTVLYVTDFKGNDELFVYYFFKAFNFNPYNSGSAQSSLNRNYLYTVPIKVPPLNEQKAIAHILGILDDKIELNQQMNHTLESIARALFKSWFIDFDPVRAKMDGRQLAGMDAETAALFPAEFEDSPLGKIPKGYRAGKLGDIVGLLGGYAFKSKDWSQEGVPVVKIGSVKPGIVDLEKVSFVSKEIAQNAQKFQLQPADLLIGMTGYVGEVGMVPFTENYPLLNQRVGKFVLYKGIQDLAFLYCLTRRPEFKVDVEMRAHGTAQANISPQVILSIPRILPDSLVISRFNHLCYPILEKILHNYSEIQKVSSIRDALLPKLLFGEVSVKKAEKVLEVVA